MDKKRYAVIEKYTAPFVQLVIEKHQADQVYDRLETMKTIMVETNLVDFLSHIGVDPQEKAKAIRLFKVGDASLIDNLLDLLILNKREDLLFDIIQASLAAIEKETNTYVVAIKSVQALSEEQKGRLLPIIEEKLGLKVRSIKNLLDPSLIGGFVITANNKTIDLSLKEQLQRVKKNMK